MGEVASGPAPNRHRQKAALQAEGGKGAKAWRPEGSGHAPISEGEPEGLKGDFRKSRGSLGRCFYSPLSREPRRDTRPHKKFLTAGFAWTWPQEAK